jgi:hypothetical protein
MPDDSKTLTWMDACGRIVTLEVTADVAAKIDRGERASW